MRYPPRSRKLFTQLSTAFSTGKKLRRDLFCGPTKENGESRPKAPATMIRQSGGALVRDRAPSSKISRNRAQLRSKYPSSVSMSWFHVKRRHRKACNSAGDRWRPLRVALPLVVVALSDRLTYQQGYPQEYPLPLSDFSTAKPTGRRGRHRPRTRKMRALLAGLATVYQSTLNGHTTSRGLIALPEVCAVTEALGRTQGRTPPALQPSRSCISSSDPGPADALPP